MNELYYNGYQFPDIKSLQAYKAQQALQGSFETNPTVNSYAAQQSGGGRTGTTGAVGAGEASKNVAGAVSDVVDPTKDNTQKALGATSKTAGALAALGVGGAAMPVIGTAAAIGGLIYDYNKQQEAERKMRDALKRQEEIRNSAMAKYNRELDDEYARRELGMRGQMAQLPQYQAMQAQAAKNYRLGQQQAADQLQKAGMGEKSGMLAQLAGQNYSNLQSGINKAMNTQIANMPRAYGGLGGLATSTAPETNAYNMNQNMYNEYKGFGENLSGVADLLSTYSQGWKKQYDLEKEKEQLAANRAGV